MKEKLIIKNFGPLKSVDLDLGKITVLIGEQATGKSTVAKVLSICRYFSYIIDNKNPLIYKSRFIEYGLTEWDLKDFEYNKTFISYENNDYLFQVKSNLDSYIQTLKPKSQRFTELLNQLKTFKSDLLTDINIEDTHNWNLPYTFLTTDVKKVMDNPFYFPTERGLQSVFSLGKSSIQYLSDSLFTQLADLYNITLKFKKEVEIKPLEIYYKNENGKGLTRKKNENNFYRLSNGASGYQSTIPVVLTIRYYNEIEKRKRTFIVEEPEQNLFPKTQKKLVEFFAESVTNFDNQFVLPTHSPYILSTLSNLIYAHKIGTSEDGMFEKEVNSIIPKESWIDVKNISVYNLENGYAEDLVDVEECIINLEYIDSVSKFLNNDFDKILEIDIALDKIIH